MTKMLRVGWFLLVGEGPNTVSESTVSNPELTEFFGFHQVLRRELSEFLPAYYSCAKANSPSFAQNSLSLPQNSVSSLFRNSTVETVFCPFPNWTWVYAERCLRDACVMVGWGSRERGVDSRGFCNNEDDATMK